MTGAGLPLGGLAVTTGSDDGGVAHAARLLGALGASVRAGSSPAIEAAGERVEASGVVGREADWAASGAVWLTGTANGPPLLPPGHGATAARGAMLAFELLSALAGTRVALAGHLLLGEHAAARDLGRRGPFSANGTTRVLGAPDGLVALSLARPDDLAVLPALVGAVAVDEPWAAIGDWVSRTRAADAVGWAQTLGLAAAVIPTRDSDRFDEQAIHRGQIHGFEPFVIDGRVARTQVGAEVSTWRPRPFAPLVVDLSSLWAGPLCAHLLGLAGARVVKVESTRRPDGARRGPTTFYDLLHSGHESVALDFADPIDVDRLRRLVGIADVVVEASRPRAMAQLGIDPAGSVDERPDTTWVAITAYGRTGPWANRVGFGDDAALAAGLAAVDPESGQVVPCGDAIADPLTGMHAAVAALASVLGGESRVIDVALRDVVAATLPTIDREASRPSCSIPVEPPVIRPTDRRAPASGEHTGAVLAEFGLS